MFSQLQEPDEVSPRGTKGDPGIQSTVEYRLMMARRAERLEVGTALMLRVFAVLLATVGMAVDEVPVGVFAIILMMLAARVDR